MQIYFSTGDACMHASSSRACVCVYNYFVRGTVIACSDTGGSDDGDSDGEGVSENWKGCLHFISVTNTIEHAYALVGVELNWLSLSLSQNYLLLFFRI